MLKFQRCVQIIEELNGLIAGFSEGGEIPEDFQLNPQKGNVAFGSGKLGWAFTVPSFAEYLSVKANSTKEKLAEKLWGDIFWVESTKSWTYDFVNGGVRGFCKYAMNPICKLLNVRNSEKVSFLTFFRRQLAKQTLPL